MTSENDTAPEYLATTAGRIADHRLKYQEAVGDRDAAAAAKQHPRGKMTARERIASLLDPGSFVEFDKYVKHRATAFGMDANKPFGDAVVTGAGTIHGRQVVVYSQDFTTFGGSLGEAAGDKIVKAMDFAMKTGAPIIGMLDSGGARIQEGVFSLSQYAKIFKRNTMSSGVIPQISIVMGPSAGGAVYSPALTDFVIMVDKTSNMFVTGPDVIKTVTGEEVGFEELGGALTHNKTSGVSHYLASDELDALDYARTLISFLPDNNLAEAPIYDSDTAFEITEADRRLNTIIPDSQNQPYDMKVVIEAILDGGDFLEVQPLFAPNILIGFGRVEGRTVGIVANQPEPDGGHPEHRREREGRALRALLRRVLDPDPHPRRRARLPPRHRAGVSGRDPPRREAAVRVCRSDRAARHHHHPQGLRRRVHRDGLKEMGADFNIAWPTAEIAVMGGAGAVNILYRKELAAAEAAGEDVEALRAKLTAKYTADVTSPFLAAERGEIDNVLEPAGTRLAVIKALRGLRGKRDELPAKKHGNIPL